MTSIRHDYTTLDPETCKHEREFVPDWDWDPTVPNGAKIDCSYYRCSQCGAYLPDPADEDM